eukprot:4880246-Alexandrium_andersonii.AAC.1
MGRRRSAASPHLLDHLLAVEGALGQHRRWLFAWRAQGSGLRRRVLGARRACRLRGPAGHGRPRLGGRAREARVGRLAA